VQKGCRDTKIIMGGRRSSRVLVRVSRIDPPGSSSCMSLLLGLLNFSGRSIVLRS
jgi:hypothetical protein